MPELKIKPEGRSFMRRGSRMKTVYLDNEFVGSLWLHNGETEWKAYDFVGEIFDPPFATGSLEDVMQACETHFLQPPDLTAIT